MLLQNLIVLGIHGLRRISPIALLIGGSLLHLLGALFHLPYRQTFLDCLVIEL